MNMGLSAWESLLDEMLGITGVIAASTQVIRRHGAPVASADKQEAANISVGIFNAENRHAAIGKTAGIDAQDDPFWCRLAPIHGEVNETLP
jgi:hypothetical protein